MKGLAVVALVLGAMPVALAPVGGTLYRQVYPADRARERALAACVRADPAFDRLSADARAACYARFSHPRNQPNPEPAGDIGWPAMPS